MLLLNYGVSRKIFSILLFLLLLLPILDAGDPIDSHFVRRRAKRLSSPYFDKEKTLVLAKYVVSIRSRRPHKLFGDNHFCGGVIISRTYILTSAHCAMDKRKIVHRSRVLVVVAGTTNRLKSRKGLSLNMEVKKIFVPDKFTVFNTNNIALMMLAKKLPLDNPLVGVINLPTADPEPGLNYTVLGWGRIFKGGPLASDILHIDVELLPRDICEKKVHILKEEMLCAGNLNNTMDENPCAGDTGSPLIFNETVFGVVSYRVGCGSRTLPSIYTNVYMHMDWINGIMNNNVANRLYYSPNYLFTTIGIFIGNKILKSWGFYLITT
ncbi:trypsin I-P1 isoform X1 [Drosophila sechellia]|uniref:GM14910 n=1 Tax=Drosophila sechellia TaxID=7238 RepID=B4IFX9_DROSE|nr:trypsin I-P1 isoform X1 [Drosophila sechellia]EDW46566.1 GM14910 [Drosophila sechellia]